MTKELKTETELLKLLNAARPSCDDKDCDATVVGLTTLTDSNVDHNWGVSHIRNACNECQREVVANTFQLQRKYDLVFDD